MTSESAGAATSLGDVEQDLVRSARATPAPPQRWWHGGSRIVGDMVLPPDRTGRCRSGDHAFDAVVFITPTRDLALTYAATAEHPWLYEVAPIGDIQQDPGSILPPGESMLCSSARIVRRFKPSSAEVERRRAVVRAFGGPS